MIDLPLILVIVSLLTILLILVALLKPKRQSESTSDEGAEETVRRAPRVPRPVVQIGGERRRTRTRMTVAATTRHDSDEDEGVGLPIPDDDEDDGLEEDEFAVGPDGAKIGAKKRKMLVMKAEKKAQRERDLEEREERKQRQAKLDEERRKQDEREKAEEAQREEEERLRKEEIARKEHEEYLQMKEMFSVEEQGFEEGQDENESQDLLREFVDYIKNCKVVLMEDLAAQFKLKTQEAIDRIQTLQESGELTGVVDDRGKFIYISKEELESIAKFIKQRGRVSISELVESSNGLINFTPCS